MKKDSKGIYSTSPQVMALSQMTLIDDFCEDIYSGKGRLLPRLARWLDSVADNWANLPEGLREVPMLQNMLTGAAIAPMLLDLREKVGSDGNVILDEKSSTAWAVGGFFGAQNWGAFDPSTKCACAAAQHDYRQSVVMSRLNHSHQACHSRSQAVSSSNAAPPLA